MPRTYKRKTNKGGWTAEQIQAAISAVKGGLSIRAAGREYKIPEATIRKKIKLGDNVDLTKNPHLGKFPVFTEAQETELAQHVVNLAKMFYGLSPIQFRKLAFAYAEANGIQHSFNKDTKLAGKDFYYGFLKRHPEISLRKPEGTSLNRIKAFNRHDVQLFFANLDQLYEKYKFTPDNIYNVDETGITTVQRPSKCLSPKGIKQLGYKTSGERGKNVTIICCMNASGNKFIAPMFIFPRKRMTPALEKHGPLGAIYSCSDTGWSNEVLFLEWLHHFAKSVKPSVEDPVLIIMDNHSSHISLGIFNFCKSKGIVLVTLPPHTSHKLQPLDLTFFGPLKSAYNRQCDLFLRTKERITTYDLAEIFAKAYEKVVTMDKAISGFDAAGIWELKPEKFTDEDFAPSTQFTAVIDENNEDEQTQVNIPMQASSDKLPNKKSSHVTADSLCPLPSTSGTQSKVRRTKQKSKILTATPNKADLVAAEDKRKKRRAEVDKKKPIKGKKKNLKRVLFESSDDSSNDIDPSKICDDDEMDDLSDADKDTCLICGDFSKKNEVWYRCTNCSGWSHALCSGCDSAENYICDICS